MTRQHPGHRRTYVTDAQSGQQPGHRSVPGGVDRLGEIIDRDLAPALELEELGRVEREDVGGIGDQIVLQEQIDGLVAHVLDVHAAPAGEVEEPLTDA